MENFNIFKQRILSHEAAIVQPCFPRWKMFVCAHAQRPPHLRLRSYRLSFFWAASDIQFHQSVSPTYHELKPDL